MRCQGTFEHAHEAELSAGANRTLCVVVVSVLKSLKCQPAYRRYCIIPCRGNSSAQCACCRYLSDGVLSLISEWYDWAFKEWPALERRKNVMTAVVAAPYWWRHKFQCHVQSWCNRPLERRSKINKSIISRFVVAVIWSFTKCSYSYSHCVFGNTG